MPFFRFKGSMSKINIGKVKTGLELYNSPMWKSIQNLNARRLLFIKTQSKACATSRTSVPFKTFWENKTLKSLIYTKVLASVQKLFTKG